MRYPSALLRAIFLVLAAVVGSAAAACQADEPEKTPEVFAFYADWVDNSRTSLQTNVHLVDVLMPDWLRLEEGLEGFSEPDAAQRDATLEIIAEAGAVVRIAPLLSASPALGSEVIGTEQARARLVDGLADYLLDHGYAGITIGFWSWPAETASLHEAFAVQLYQRFEPLGLQVYHAVPMGGSRVPLPLLVANTDAIVVLGDGESQSQAGPLASESWYRAGLARWTSLVPPEKLVMGVFSQAVRWNLNSGAGEYISVMDAFGLADQHGVEPLFDPVSRNTTFNYVDGASEHAVWMLDASAAYNWLTMLADYPIKGLALQRLGSEDPSLWPLLTNLDHASLTTIDASHIVSRSGNGEAITLARLPQSGVRSIELSPDNGTVVASRIERLPHGYDIAHRDGIDENMIALTFDDGPHPIFTPQILDILARYNVKATFFAVGHQMMKYPDLVERMLAEGHEVGSHTYSHVNISSVSLDVLRLDLNATQSIFEATTGRNLAMFRAPYAVDANAETPQEVAPLALTTELGYLTINMNIDPRDWWLPTAGRIRDSVVSQSRMGLGNIVLLHDGGGDRAETVAALPGIIETLLSDGRQLVPVSELLGHTRDEVMPISRNNVGLLREFKALGFAMLRHVLWLAEVFFVLAVCLGIGRSVLLIGLSFFRRSPPEQSGHQVRSVGVVIAAYNEEKVILNTVESVLRSTHSDLKILIVDDGSTDGTYELCKSRLAGNPRVAVITQSNRGKAAALNNGFRLLDTDIIVALDADTIFLNDTIELLVRHFDDQLVAAVSGNAKVGNRETVLTKLQALEYITAQNMDRRAFDALNCITVVPGAVGAWRRDRVLEAGGYLLDTLAEDADLTIRLIRNGYRVAYDDRAIALTEAPETVAQFLKQRFRWMFGMLQVAAKHRGAMKLRDSKTMGLVGLPNIILFQVLFPLLAPLADLMALGILLDMATKLTTNSADINAAQSLTFLGMFFAFLLLDALTALIAFKHEKRENPWLLLWILPQRFFYRQLLYLVAIRAALVAIRGSVVGWGTLTRSASVSVDQEAKWSH